MTQATAKRLENMEMNQNVQQYNQDEHLKKVKEVDVKTQMMSELQRQIEENKRIKEQKARDEKEKDAALVREYDRMMLEREAQRNAVV